MRYIVFNFNTMPYGATTAGCRRRQGARRPSGSSRPDRPPGDRRQVYKDTYTPLYSFVPDGLTGATTVLKDLYGDGKGGPDADKAKKTLADAGVTTPVVLNLQYNTDHYGESSADEYALVKSQLEASGLFTVNLQSTEYTQYSKDRAQGRVPGVPARLVPGLLGRGQLPDAVLRRGQLPGEPLQQPRRDRRDRASRRPRRTRRPARRRSRTSRRRWSADLPTLPLLQGSQVVVTGTDISGTTLDGAFKFRFGTLTKADPALK